MCLLYAKLEKSWLDNSPPKRRKYGVNFDSLDENKCGGIDLTGTLGRGIHVYWVCTTTSEVLLC